MYLKRSTVLWSRRSFGSPSLPACAHFVNVRTRINQVDEKQQYLRGNVVDTQGNPIAGATVVNTRTKVSTQTGMDGAFVIQGIIGDPLSANFIGFSPATQDASTNQNILFTLASQSQEIDEVLVSIGYQRVRKSDVT